MSIKNVAIYCRVAHEDDYALENQKAKLMEYALGQGYNVKAVVSESVYASDTTRHGLREVCTAISNGDVDALLVNCTSRIYRDISSLYKFIDFLKENDVQLISRKEGFVCTNMNMWRFFETALHNMPVSN